MAVPGWPREESPFHRGEREVQVRAGVREHAEASGRRIVRDFMLPQHREFFSRLPFAIIGHFDGAGRPWASLLAAGPGFIQSPTATSLILKAQPFDSDPLATGLRPGAAVGLLGIELATRRRNRIRASVSRVSDGELELSVVQSFGNCPQYISSRALDGVEPAAAAAPAAGVEPIERFGARERAAWSAADTFFIATGAPVERGGQYVVDASHRGGRPGFIHVDDDTTLMIPDFPGNNHFNTLGNIETVPRAGLLFIDFERGDVSMLSGTADVLWDGPEVEAFRGAARVLRFRLEAGRRLVRAFPWRGRLLAAAPEGATTGTWAEAARARAALAMREQWREHRVCRVDVETANVRSFCLEPVDGTAIADFEAGQFVPVRVQLPGAERPVVRTYSVSSSPGEPILRITVKRIGTAGARVAGSVSAYLHDDTRVGSIIQIKAPRGAFTLDPGERRPAALISSGIGVTPLMGMLRAAVREGLRTGRYRRLALIRSARCVADLALHDEARQLASAANGAVQVHAFVGSSTSEERMRDPSLVEGRVSAPALQALLPSADCDVYLCGPPAFMQGIYDMLLTLGVAEERIFSEAFGPARLVRRASAGGSRRREPGDDVAERAVVRFGVRSSDLCWTRADGTLLEFAEKSGLRPMYGCRNGRCGTCVMRIEHGSVVYFEPPCASVPRDRVLICCAAPAAAQGALPRLVLSETEPE